MINERGVKSLLQWDSVGNIVSAFEVDDNGYVRTLERESGQMVSMNTSTTNEKINGHNIAYLKGETAIGQFDLGTLGNNKYKNFQCSFWLKLNTNKSGSNLKVLLKLNDKTFSAPINGNAVGVWQKVIVPMPFGSVPENDNVTLSANISYNDGSFCGAYIAEIFIKPAGVQTQYVDGQDIAYYLLNNNSNFLIRKVDGSVSKVNFSDIVMTSNDILNAITHPIAIKNCYDLIYNGGRNRIANVTSLYTSSNSGNLLTGQKEAYSENYTPDGSSTTKNSFKRLNKDGKIVYEIKQLTTADKKSSSKTSLIDEYERLIEEFDAYGIKTQYEYDDDSVTGRCGLLKSAKRYVGDDSGKYMLVEEHKYDENKEYPLASTDGILSQGYHFNPNFSQLEKAVTGSDSEFNVIHNELTTSDPEKLITRYGYNNYGDQLLSITRSNHNRITPCITMSYENGRLRALSPGRYSYPSYVSNGSYGIIHDLVNDKVSYTNLLRDTEKVIVAKESDRENFVTTTTYYEYGFNNQKRAIGTSVLTLDKYGRAVLNAYGEDENLTNKTQVSYAYQESNGESTAAGKLVSIADGFESRNYNYIYDDNMLVGWDVCNSDKENFIAVHQISAGETIYSFGKKNGSEQSVSEKYKMAIVYDEKKTIDPRITATNLYYDNNSDDKDDWSGLGFYSRQYGYDDLGRLTKVEKPNTFFTCSSTYDYNDTDTTYSPQLKSYQYSSSKDTNVKYDYTYYDETGRVKTETQTFSGPRLEELKVEKEYEYDEYGQVTKVKISDEENNYIYFSNGMLWQKDKDRVYRHDPFGRLTEIRKFGGGVIYSITYDNYGNCKQVSAENGQYRSYSYERGNLLSKIFDIANYYYNHCGVRYKKDVFITPTMRDEVFYYNDGAKILGEDRIVAKGYNKKLRYFYDLTGLNGFTYEVDSRSGYTTKSYSYVKDPYGNVVLIEDINGTPIVRYSYDIFGKCTIRINTDGTWKDIGEVSKDNEIREIAEANPFRWKSHYYDQESGLYYINGRYYDPEFAIYVDADDIENVYDADAAIVSYLSRWNITTDNNYLNAAPYGYNIFTTDVLAADDNYNPYANYTWWDKHWRDVLSIGFQVASTAVCFATGHVAGGVLGALGLAGSITGLALETTFPGYNRVLGGAGTILNGASALSTGLSIIGSCASGNILGALCIIAGISAVGLGANELLAGAIGVNIIQNTFNMSEEDYNRLYMGINITTAIVNVAGQLKSNCFKEGTLVETEAGLKPIEEIEVGDKVLAYDETTGEQAYKPVVRLFRNETKEWYHVFADGEEIVCTGGHPFYVVGVGFVEARNLKISEKLLLSSGKEVIIEKVEAEQLAEAETTYNFEVAAFHTYYVSEKKVLVHNKCERAAMRAAKRSENISMSQKPDKIIVEKAVLGADGHYYQPKTYVFGDKFIRNDFGGHLFPDGHTLGSHFNAGKIIDGRFIGNKLHFFYGG